MKKIIKNIAILITSVVVVMMIVSQILFKNPLSLIYIPVWIIEVRKGIDEEYNKAIKKEETNREENRILAEKWLINTYGDIISEATTIEFSNRIQGWGVDSVFRIESPFATGSIYVNSETKKVDGGFNLMSIKFQHLYSEWVKKQVGIEDENVELEFKGALKSSAWVGEKPCIEFDKITDLDYLEEDICKNTHNLYLHTVVIDKFNSSSVNEVLELVKSYEKLLKPYVFTDGDNVLWFGVKLNDLVNDKEDPFSYGILFDYNKNEKKYYKYYENRSVENNKSEYILFE